MLSGWRLLTVNRHGKAGRRPAPVAIVPRRGLQKKPDN
ncbi:hypothetical protein I546_4110 [Mycobacterium kansasii 732]|nr:hypothetical protein I546_4110 [Mycobacterium kansasii 732]